ncbi:uncharacterized protein TNCV_3399891 [Trichonephila clavipes]|nr:uncharacterized protein TNCV_3399891 [Trichonephila clavipes]
MSLLQTHLSMVCRGGILYKGTLSRSPRCSRRRRIDEVDIKTPVPVDQRSTNCLEEAVRSFTGSRFRSLRSDVNFRRPLPVFLVVRCSSVHCFQTRITVELFSAHELLLRNRKILLLKV